MSLQNLEIASEIFRAYDIRGRVDETLTPEILYTIGRAYATVLLGRSASNRLVIGSDGRNSSDGFRREFARGITDSGFDVIDVGMVPTPLVYFAGAQLDVAGGGIVTGSHNPPSDNGIKLFLDGLPFADVELQELLACVRAGEFATGHGEHTQAEILDTYVDTLCGDVNLTQPLRVVIDTGNGVAGVVTTKAFEALGCEVIPLFETVDGSFPNHHPDPSQVANLATLIETVQSREADLGLGFDGDGDRLGVVTNEGRFVSADPLMAVFSRELLNRHPSATIVFDVKTGRIVTDVLKACGGQAIVCATGHTNIKREVAKHKAIFGGEFSGHFCFADRWYGFDDAIYAGARLLEILANSGESAAALFAEFADFHATPELFVVVDDRRKFALVEQLRANGLFKGGELSSVDGVRVDFDFGWGLVRASNTGPKLTLRFEAESVTSLRRVQHIFFDNLRMIEPSLKLPNFAA